MSGFIFLLLPLSIIVVCALTALAFADAAFRELRVSEVRGDAAAFRLWGRTLAKDIATIQGVASPSLKSEPRAKCECECNEFIPLVTDHEAIAICQELQEHPTELQQVQVRLKTHGKVCPMRSQTGVCACSTARPISCIGRCVGGEECPEWMHGLGDTVFTAFCHHLEDRHQNVRTRRLDEALDSLLKLASDNVV